MPILVEKLLVILGYPELTPHKRATLIGSERLNGVNLILSSDREARVNVIVLELAQIDALLVESRANTMAKQLGSMTLDFKFHLQALRGEGSRYLTELAQLTRLPLYYDRYRDEYPGSSSFYRWFGVTKPSNGSVSSQW